MITLTDKQELYLQSLENSLGIISVALRVSGVEKDEYISWLDNKEFTRRLELVGETSIDYVENKLLGLINKGDLSAIQFFLKTKGKKRGY